MMEKQDTTRINERIRIRNVRLIDEEGNQVGVIATIDALRMAQEKGLDLVEVAAQARPPVCRIMDYGKFKYEKKKRQKKSKTSKLREIRLRPSIDEHDYQVKLNKSREFLTRKDTVQFTLQFKGRQNAHKDQGRQLLNRITSDLADVGKIERHPRNEGRRMIMILSPK